MITKHFAVAAVVAITAFAGLHCSAKSESGSGTGTTGSTVRTPAEAPPASPDSAPATDPEFRRFVIKDFNWEIMGYDVVVIRHDGGVTYVAPSAEYRREGGEKVMVPVWHRMDWSIGTDELVGLVAAIKASRFRKLDALYIDRGVEDGSSTEYILHDTAGSHKVSCSNKYPPEIRALQKHIYDNIVGERRESIKKAPRLEHSEAEKYWKQF